jgi:alkanesulfonate monooxygenase SsuD/methylene tetrahydromethanopterin reductase-like flavin-dependent oxidoreductase (luciferase family)
MATMGVTNGGVWWPSELYPVVEELGFDTIWTSEHIMLWRPIFDGIPLMAGIAACTKRIKIGSAVLLFPPRHPAILAKELTTVDRMSGGRLIVGAGAGGDYRPELEVAGVAKNFGRRFNEMIDLMRQFWTEEWVTFHGEFFDMENMGLMEPKPVQPGGPPLLVGGRSDAALTRAVVRGDGYMPYMYHARRVREAYGEVRAKAEELGVELRPGFMWSCFVYVSMHENRDLARRYAIEDLSWRYNRDMTELVEKYVIWGTPDEVRAGLQEYMDAGVEDFAIGSLHEHSLVENAVADDGQAKAAEEMFHYYAEELLPHVQGRRDAQLDPTPVTG